MDGVSYKYAMFFLSNPMEYYYNEIGVAFSNDLAADSGSLETAKKICKTDLMEYTKQGFDNKMEELKSWGLGADAEQDNAIRHPH